MVADIVYTSILTAGPELILLGALKIDGNKVSASSAEVFDLVLDAAEHARADAKDPVKRADWQVAYNLDVIPNYPLGEPDAMKWAIAWRMVRDLKGIDANGGVKDDIDGWMVGWFANCMASAPEAVKMKRS